MAEVSEPLIPLMPAELLLVATSTMAHFISKKTNYPVGNIDCVINAYRAARDKHLKSIGYNTKQINSFTETAAEALVSWLEERSMGTDQPAADFDKWAQEMLGE